MSDVREILVNAMGPSAARSRLGKVWGRRFSVATQKVYDIYERDSPGCVGRPYLDEIVKSYTEREIITILAAARLEGVWTPE